MKKFLFSIFYFLISFNLVLADAQPCGVAGAEPCGLQNPLASGNIIEIINGIISAIVTYIAPPIVAIMILIGAFQILFAAGDEEKFKTGRKIIYYAVIGYVIIIVAWGAVFIIKELLGIK